MGVVLPRFGFSANCSHAAESFWLLGICLLLLNFLRPQRGAATETHIALFGSLHMYEFLGNLLHKITSVNAAAVGDGSVTRTEVTIILKNN